MTRRELKEKYGVKLIDSLSEFLWVLHRMRIKDDSSIKYSAIDRFISSNFEHVEGKDEHRQI